MSNSADPITMEKIIALDGGLGLLAALTTLKKIHHSGSDLNVEKLIIEMKRTLALESAFFGKDCANKTSEICNLSFSDHLLFEVNYSNVDSLRDKIFDELIVEGYFKRHNSSLIPRCRHVEKDENKIMENQKRTREILEKHFDTCFSIPYYPNISREKIIQNSGLFRRRLDLTMELSNNLEKLNDEQFKEMLEKVVDPSIMEGSKNYAFGKHLSVVGFVPNHDKENFCHILCYYYNTKNQDLNNASIQMDNFLPKILAQNPNICKTIKKIGDVFFKTEDQSLSFDNNQAEHHKGSGKKEIFVKKILTRPINSDIILAVYSISFFKDILKEKEIMEKKRRSLPLGELRKYIESNLPGWEVSQKQRPSIAWKKIPFCEECYDE